VQRLQQEADLRCATLACPFPASANRDDPNCVKVVTDLSGAALYFSRARIPFPREADGKAPCLLHLGVYAFRRTALLEFAGWEPTPLERCEQLEQLRMLEHGWRVGVVRVERAFVGIDTPEDYRRFVARWRAAQAGG